MTPREPGELEELWRDLGVVGDWLAAAPAAGAWGGPRGATADSPPDFAGLAALAASRDAAGDSEASPPGGVPAAAAHPAPVAAPRLDPEEATRRLAALSREAAVCSKCRLGSSRRNVAFGEGVPAPLVLVVGEGPGAEEDASGRPFVGPAGKLLDRMLAAVGLSREENCYIGNVVKCRPPGNRDPAPDEEAACMPWLRAQVEILRPEIILCMGRVAARALTGSAEGIGRLRGRWLEAFGIPLIATYHPSALLRDEALKRPAWEDLKLLKARLDGSSG